MLGRSHKEVVEMLKSVPMGQSVDVVLRRGYPMLYNPDGCPKQSLEMVQFTLGPVVLRNHCCLYEQSHVSLN